MITILFEKNLKSGGVLYNLNSPKVNELYFKLNIKLLFYFGKFIKKLSCLFELFLI